MDLPTCFSNVLGGSTSEENVTSVFDFFRVFCHKSKKFRFTRMEATKGHIFQAKKVLWSRCLKSKKSIISKIVKERKGFTVSM